MELWLTLLFLWVGWKVLSAVLEELEQRKRRQSGDEGREVQPRAQRQAPPAGRIPDTQRRRVPSPEREENELERLLREAMEQRRRRQEPPASRVPEPAAEPVRVEPRPVEAARPETAFPRAEPAPSRYQVEYRQTTRRERPIPREAAVAAQAQARKAAAAPQRPVKKRVQMKEQPTSAVHSIIGRLDRDEVRRGIILSEILGPPKALRDMFDAGPNVLYQ